MKYNLIGIAGSMRSGKTTVADKIQRDFGFEVLSFASPLKEALSAMTGLPMGYFYDCEEKEKIRWFGQSLRHLMQQFGTEFVRETVHKDFWTLRMQKELAKRGVDYRIIIDDVRFENEADLIRQNGGLVVHISRPQYGEMNADAKHISEASLVPYGGDISIALPEGIDEAYMAFINKVRLTTPTWRL